MKSQRASKSKSDRPAVLLSPSETADLQWRSWLLRTVDMSCSKPVAGSMVMIWKTGSERNPSCCA